MVARNATSPTANLFLSGIALIYSWAFLSLYPQLPGLYGPTGILPVHRLHSQFATPCTSLNWNDIKQNPTLFCMVNDLKVSPIYLMEFFCLIGIFLSFMTFLSHFIRHNLTFIAFALLWLLYLSLFSVGQTFMSFQWDLLLLEVGFLCIFMSSSVIRSRCDDIIFFLVRWLLFRLMFASFLVKLQSNCPTWWGLSALDWHYESQCIPTPASWYFHFLPKWINHLSVVGVYIIEGPLSILYILPTHFGSKHMFRSSRYFAAYSNIFLMLLIAISGNYNFFNALTIILTLSCFDDEHIAFIQSKIIFWRQRQCVKNQSETNKYLLRLLYFIELALWIAFIFGIIHYFGLSITANDKNIAVNDSAYGKLVYFLNFYQIECEIKFSMDYLNENASKFMMFGVCLGFVNIACYIMHGFYSYFADFISLCFMRRKDLMTCCEVIGLIVIFIYRTFVYLVKISVGFYIFNISLIPFLSGIDTHQYTLHLVLGKEYFNFIRNDLYMDSYPFHLVNSYGLFRRMTGVGGRPEIEIYVHAKEELSPLDEAMSGWHRVPFLYKPNDLNIAPKFIAPHQPRLDWQLWFAALGNYQNNPWFISFLYQLIAADQFSAVYDLIDDENYLFSPGKNGGFPKYIMANLYTYHYTEMDAGFESNVCSADEAPETCKANSVNKGIWWTREYKREYFPVLKYSELGNIKSWMKKNGFLDRPVFVGESETNKLAKSIRYIRRFYREFYHRKYDVVLIIYGATMTLFVLRIVHEKVQNSEHVLK